MVRYGGEGLAFRTLGRTGFEVTPLCVGSAPLGNTPLPYKQDVPLEDALATVRRVFAGPHQLPRHEQQLRRRRATGSGSCIRELGAAPRRLRARDQGRSRHGHRRLLRRPRAAARSRSRSSGSASTGSGLVHLHDPENIIFEEGVAKGGPLEALQAAQGRGRDRPPRRRRRPDRPDAALHPHRRVRRRAHPQPLQPRRPVRRAAADGGRGARRRRRSTRRRSAAGSSPARRTRRASSPTATRARRCSSGSRRLRAACDRHGVPLAAAALQFPMREPRITATLAGCVKPERGRPADRARARGRSRPSCG